MASGVKVSDAVFDEYKHIKKGKKHRYLIFHIKDEKTIDIEKFGDREEGYDDYLKHLEALGGDECRYGLYDFEYEHQCQGTSEQTKKQKLFLMIWCPDTARIKKKMLYSSSFDALKHALEGVPKYIRPNCTVRGLSAPSALRGALLP